MKKLSIGETVRLVCGREVVVTSCCGEGRSCCLYVVEHNSDRSLLKWYKEILLGEPNRFYSNVHKNVMRGAPSKSFLWAIDITENIEGSFGYCTAFPPSGYRSLASYFTTQDQWVFKSYRMIVESCMQIASAFGVLHQEGYCYQSFDLGSILVNPETGDVLICDNDNVAPNNGDVFDYGSFCLRAPELVAPEVLDRTVASDIEASRVRPCDWDPTNSESQEVYRQVVRELSIESGIDLGMDLKANGTRAVFKAQPSSSTDYWSLAVVLFMILCKGHPLEGEKWLKPLMTPADECALYGSNATFVCSPIDSSNRLNPVVHANVIARWELLPSYVKNVFMRAFSRDAVRNPNSRLREIDWMRVLARFQAEIVRCRKCSAEVFMSDADNAVCNECGEVQRIGCSLRFRDFTVAATEGMCIYRCMLGSSSAMNALARVGTIVVHPSKAGMYFRNDSGATLLGRTPKGTVKVVPPEGVVPLKPGITVEFDFGQFAVE